MWLPYQKSGSPRFNPFADAKAVCFSRGRFCFVVQTFYNPRPREEMRCRHTVAFNGRSGTGPFRAGLASISMDSREM